MIVILILLLILSFVIALHSMKDFYLPKEIRRLIEARRVRGTILFLKGKIEHYSSKSSSASSGR